MNVTVYSGWQLAVLMATGSATGSFYSPSTGIVTFDGIQSLSYDYVQRIEAKEETGKRTVAALVEGVTGITGTLERFWTGSGVQALGFDKSTTGSALPSRSLMLCPNGFNVVGNPYIVIADLKWDSQRVTHRPGSNLMTESLGFIATYEYSGSF